MSYSIEIRKKTLELKKSMVVTDIARLLKVGVASIYRWQNRIEDKPRVIKPRKMDVDKLKKDIEEYPDGYQIERAARLGVSEACVNYWLQKLGYSRKKNKKSIQK